MSRYRMKACPNDCGANVFGEFWGSGWAPCVRCAPFRHLLWRAWYEVRQCAARLVHP